MFLLAAGNSEETIWVQLLIVVILACAAGIYTLAKSRKRIRRYTQDNIIETIIESPPAASPNINKKQFVINSAPALHSPKGEGWVSASSSMKSPVKAAPVRFEFKTPVKKSHDTSGGMELLTRDFLVGIVEKVNCLDKPDIAMRSMCWNELSRRGELFALSSESLKIYILNDKGFFDKSIRREAMVELAGRTERSGALRSPAGGAPPSSGTEDDDTQTIPKIETTPQRPVYKAEPPKISI
jgi:hypothetical protein